MQNCNEHSHNLPLFTNIVPLIERRWHQNFVHTAISISTNCSKGKKNLEDKLENISDPHRRKKYLPAPNVT